MFGIEVAMVGVLVLYGYYLILCLWQHERFNEFEEAFALPDNFSPGDIGYLEKGRFDFELFAAEILYLEAGGYLSIQPEGSSYVFKRLALPDEALPESSRVLMSRIFADDATFIMARFNQNKLRKVAKMLESQYQKAFKAYYHYRPSIVGTSVILGAMTLMLPMSVIFFQPQLIATRVLILLFSLIVTLICWLMLRFHRAGLFGAIPESTLLKILMLNLSFGIFCYCLDMPDLTLFTINFAVLGMWLCMQRTWKTPSKLGYQLIRRINGFKLYLSRVDLQTGYISVSDILQEYDRSSPYAFALAKEFSLIQKYRGILDSRLAEERPEPGYLRARFEMYVNIAQIGEMIYGHNRIIKPRLTLVTEKL